MKVVLIGSKAFDSLEYHLSDSLRQFEHTPVLIDYPDVTPVPRRFHYWITRLSERYDTWVHRQLAERILEEKPDLVIGVYRHIHPALIRTLKQTLRTVPVVQINPDHLSNLEKQQIIASDYDCYFTKEPYIAEFLRQKAGLNAYYLPEGFNPRINIKPSIEKQVAEAQANIDVLIYGGLYAYRVRMIEQLIGAGIQPVLYGSEGPYCPPAIKKLFRHQYLVGDQKNKLLYGAKIVFNTFHYAEVTSANQKFFEINGTGGFQLCDYKPTLSSYSNVDVQSFTYQTIQEAIDKIRYYLSHPQERYAIAQQHYDHFQREHTFDRRVEEMLRLIYTH